jgi:hypothetical protein
MFEGCTRIWQALPGREVADPRQNSARLLRLRRLCVRV